MSLGIYYGDLHTHCDIAYGHGTLQDALKRARQHLDFCSVTGQAAWPDMLQSAPASDYPQLVKAHDAAFVHFAGRHQRAFAETWNASEEGRFVTFPSYEVCSSAHGDHTVVGNRHDLPLVIAQEGYNIARGHDANDVLIYPHHVGYRQGLRGINWESFDESVSPFIEIYSIHGCSEDDESFQPMQLAKRMSFRDGASTISHGLRSGRKFGIVAGSDHHAAWPGSHGHGRMAVLASALTRRGIWEALKARHVYGLTGDKISVRFTIGNGIMGDTIAARGSRAIGLDIEACDFIDTIDVLRNEEPIWQCRGRLLEHPAADAVMGAKIRIEWGGVDPGNTIDFDAAAEFDGELLEIEPCFRGPNIVSALQEAGDEIDVPHRILSKSARAVEWSSRIHQPPKEFWSITQAVILKVRMKPLAKLRLRINATRIEHTLEELLANSRAHQLRGIHREGIRICRAVPESCYRLRHDLLDPDGERAVDCYRLRIRQTNAQYAWSSPVWIER